MINKIPETIFDGKQMIQYTSNTLELKDKINEILEQVNKITDVLCEHLDFHLQESINKPND